jgi:hypothetical protein
LTVITAPGLDKTATVTDATGRYRPLAVIVAGYPSIQGLFRFSRTRSAIPGQERPSVFPLDKGMIPA